ncbi:MAG: hypothetical protein NTW21_18710 [Verrucomicrobia bacterium]|nr:hypothetical protein [Verrucomicrobiota bacterium]
MASPLQFYRNFQALMRQHGIRHVLTSGMACVEYGIQQNTKDTDWIIHTDDLEQLVAMLCECERGLTGNNWVVSYRPLFGAPLLKEYHQGGWTSHLAIRDEPLAPEHHLDFFGKAPRLKDDEWLPQSGGIASRTVVAQMKKTDRAKDWPIVNGLAMQVCNEGNMEGLLHLRELSLLRQFWSDLDGSAREPLSATRPLLGNLSLCDETYLERLLMIERGIWEGVNRERYLVYQHEWKQFYGRWQQDQVGQWPSSEPFAQQHRRVSEAVVECHLPATPILMPEQKHGIFNQGIQRAVALLAATPKELEAVLFPLEVILP